MALRMYRSTTVGNAATAQTATAFSIIKTQTDRSLDLKTINTGAGLTITDDAAGNLTINTSGVAAITSGTIVGSSLDITNIFSNTVRQSATFSATSGDTSTTLTNLTGLVVTVVPGTYAFDIKLGTVSTTNCGLKVGFKLTTTVLTSIEYQATTGAAAGVSNSRGTTATDQMSLFAATVASVHSHIRGTMVVGTGGTIQLQGAQNASHADTTSVFLGSSMTFTRIA